MRSDSTPLRRLTFPRSHRLGGQRAFTAVFNHRLRKNRGPLSFVGKPNPLEHCRLGLSVSRRVGNAVTRNRIKRLLREAFRLHQHELPVAPAYDVVVVVRRHEPMPLAEYERLFLDGVAALHREQQRRDRRANRH